MNRYYNYYYYTPPTGYCCTVQYDMNNNTLVT
jgi:hypothetical protein